VKATDNDAFDAVTELIVGAPGVVEGVTELEALDAVPSPALLLAVTVNV
jgi:hypothetical protein